MNRFAHPVIAISERFDPLAEQMLATPAQIVDRVANFQTQVIKAGLRFVALLGAMPNFHQGEIVMASTQRKERHAAPIDHCTRDLGKAKNAAIEPRRPVKVGDEKIDMAELEYLHEAMVYTATT